MCIKRSENYFISDFYFALQPFLPLSDSGVIYDSDESIHSDEEEDDAFLSDIQIQEHKDANSYRLEEIAILLELQYHAYLFFRIKENTDALNSPQFRLHICRASVAVRLQAQQIFFAVTNISLFTCLEKKMGLGSQSCVAFVGGWGNKQEVLYYHLQDTKTMTYHSASSRMMFQST